jgi:hypothetical protein
MEMKQPEAISEHPMEHRRQMGEGIAEDRDRAALGRPRDVPDQASDLRVEEREVLALGVEAAEQVAETRGVLDRLVFGADGGSPRRAEAGVEQGRSRPRDRQRQEDRVGDG